MSQPTLLFVHQGAALPPWIGATLRQAREFNACPIVLVAESAALAADAALIAPGVRTLPLEELGVSDRQRAFRELSPLDRAFRAGFWQYTSERFFVVEAAMATLAIREALHVENDVMLYVEELLPRLAAAGGAGNLNDMTVLGAYRARFPDRVEHLPIVPADYPAPLRSATGLVPRDPSRYSRYAAEFGCIFDAAALGQYLGGTDPRNGDATGPGFVNESCLFDPRLLHPGVDHDAEGRRVPFVTTPGGRHAVANLHIHSKRTQDFLSRQG